MIFIKLINLTIRRQKLRLCCFSEPCSSVYFKEVRSQKNSWFHSLLFLNHRSRGLEQLSCVVCVVGQQCEMLNKTQKVEIGAINKAHHYLKLLTSDLKYILTFL